MTEFLKRLKATPRDWYLDGDRIRSACGCPVCVVAGIEKYTAKWWPQDVLTAAGLAYEEAQQVAYAADNMGPEYKALRLKLLEACGL